MVKRPQQQQFLRSCTQTLAYFALFSYPITMEELYRFFWAPGKKKMTYTQFVQYCHGVDFANEGIRYKDGFFSLAADDETHQLSISQRNKKIFYTKEKMAIAQKAVRVLQWVPFLEGVFVCNQLPITVKESSDIDVFILIKENRLWQTRFLITVILGLLGLRRTHGCEKDHICLSFYATTAAIPTFHTLMKPFPDIYFVYWYETLISLFEANRVRQSMKKHHRWIYNYLPHSVSHTHQAFGDYRVQQGWMARTVQRVLEKILSGSIGNGIEQKTKKFQKEKMAQNKESRQDHASTDVVISDTLLKFHENDRRELFAKQWQEIWTGYVK